MHTPYIAPEDEFDMYGIELDLGDWRYVIDELGVVYGRGWYPLHRYPTHPEPDPSSPLLTRLVAGDATAPAQVRVSPGIEVYSWRNEYVTLNPIDHRVEARIRLFVRRQGMGAMVRRVVLHIDLRDKTVLLPAELPAALRTQAETKGRRVLDLLTDARRERRRRLPEPSQALCATA
ncbi:hypothetical protein [Embleya sp. NBC_00896]|uniref:hypothetical protein n=1 Tax=Embleya sp. NBC_00896 TaxID=2975961 RepID=UPI002F919FB3|nr:hypothetical protein OG928_48600 [Embleya sp. NBC_00896]